MAIPFSPRLLWLFDSQAHLWFAISDQYKVVQLGPDGDTLLIIQREVTPQPVRTGELDDAVQILHSFIERGGRGETRDIPTEKPVLNRLLFDDANNLWMSTATADAEAPAGERGAHEVFDVFNPKGVFLGMLSSNVPGRLVRIRGPAVYFVNTDTLGVHYVTRGRIETR